MQRLEFRLRSEYIELNQLLKLMGLCASGGAGKALVAAGGGAVDGAGESRKTANPRRAGGDHRRCQHHGFGGGIRT